MTLLKGPSDSTIRSLCPPLHRLVYFGNVDDAQNLILQDEDINVCDPLGKTALHIAVEIGNIEMVEMLLKHGANVNTITRTKRTPIIDALVWASKKTYLVTLLIQAGATLPDKTALLEYLRINNCTSKSCIKAFQTQIKPYIHNGLLKKELSDLDAHISKIMVDLSEMIHFEIKKANEREKPLLLLLGENHYSIRSFLLEAIILYIGHSQFNMVNAMTENANLIDILSSEEFEREKEHYVPELTSDNEDYSISDSISAFCHKKGISLQIVDVESFKKCKGVRSYEECTALWICPEEMHNRNLDMVTRAKALSHKGHGVLIVGACHLQNLLEQTDLAQTYSIKALNLFDSSVTDAALDRVPESMEWLDYAHSSSIFQAIEAFKPWPHCLTPDIILERIELNACAPLYTPMRALSLSSSSSSSSASQSSAMSSCVMSEAPCSSHSTLRWQ